MRRFREHTFKLSEFDLSSEKISDIFVIKVFHQYDHRNEWVNWNGNTGIIHRGGLFDLTLEDSTDAAERSRIQGTRFIIEETPAICATGRRYAIISAELFTNHPFRKFDETRLRCLSLADVASTLSGARWFVSAIYTGKLEKLTPIDATERFFSRTSRSTGSNSYLGWSLEPRKIELQQIFECANSLA